MRRSPARVSRGPASNILHGVARANSSNFGKLFSQVAWKNHRPVRTPTEHAEFLMPSVPFRGDPQGFSRVGPYWIEGVHEPNVSRL